MIVLAILLFFKNKNLTLNRGMNTYTSRCTSICLDTAPKLLSIAVDELVNF